MTEEIESFLDLYNYSPTLILFEPLPDSNLSKEKEAISEIFKVSSKEKLNPLDIVLESLVNVVSEHISCREVTHSRDKVLINSNVRNRAVEEILRLINGDKEKLRELHREWLRMLVAFLKQLHPQNLKIDEVIFFVSNQFRISAVSAIRAIRSVSQQNSK